MCRRLGRYANGIKEAGELLFTLIAPLLQLNGTLLKGAQTRHRHFRGICRFLHTLLLLFATLQTTVAAGTHQKSKLDVVVFFFKDPSIEFPLPK